MILDLQPFRFLHGFSIVRMFLNNAVVLSFGPDIQTFDDCIDRVATFSIAGPRADATHYSHILAGV